MIGVLVFTHLEPVPTLIGINYTLYYVRATFDEPSHHRLFSTAFPCSLLIIVEFRGGRYISPNIYIWRYDFPTMGY